MNESKQIQTDAGARISRKRLIKTVITTIFYILKKLSTGLENTKRPKSNV